jgi:hypothetical protein
MIQRTGTVEFGITPNRFVNEVQEFRAVAGDPGLTFDEKKRAYGVIVLHATMLDPHAAGYESAGVALKQALCTWLDCEPIARH